MTGPTRTPRVVGSPLRAGPPERTGWGIAVAPTRLDDLTDVDAPRDAVGVLTRDQPGHPARLRAMSHRHIQAAPVEQWLIAHDLPFTPAGIAIIGESGQRILPRAVVHTAGKTRIEFAYPVAGTADLS